MKAIIRKVINGYIVTVGESGNDPMTQMFDRLGAMADKVNQSDIDQLRESIGSGPSDVPSLEGDHVFTSKPEMLGFVNFLMSEDE